MIKKILFMSMVLIFSQLSCLDTLNDAYDAKSDIPRSGLVGEWLFDSNGTKITYDTSGFGNDGVENNIPTILPFPVLTTGSDGAEQSAYSFTTIHDSIMVPDSPSLDVSYITVSFFIYTTVEGKIIMKDQEGGAGDVGTYQVAVGYDGKVYFVCFTSGSTMYELFSDGIISFNKWQHVACTFDGSTMRIYIDGMLNKEMAVSGTLRTNSLNTCIGQVKNTISDSFNGTIDNVRIYNRALSANEIKLLASE